MQPTVATGIRVEAHSVRPQCREAGRGGRNRTQERDGMYLAEAATAKVVRLGPSASTHIDTQGFERTVLLPHPAKLSLTENYTLAPSPLR